MPKKIELTSSKTWHQQMRTADALGQTIQSRKDPDKKYQVVRENETRRQVYLEALTTGSRSTWKQIRALWRDYEPVPDGYGLDDLREVAERAGATLEQGASGLREWVVYRCILPQGRQWAAIRDRSLRITWHQTVHTARFFAIQEAMRTVAQGVEDYPHS